MEENKKQIKEMNICATICNMIATSFHLKKKSYLIDDDARH